MFIAGVDDKVIGYNTPLGTIGNVVCTQGNLQQSDTGAYTASPGPPGVRKRLVGITGGGHLVPTDLCQTNAQGKNAIQEANADGVWRALASPGPNVPHLAEPRAVSREARAL